jgi:hypothetical protein
MRNKFIVTAIWEPGYSGMKRKADNSPTIVEVNNTDKNKTNLVVLVRK